MVFIVVPHIEGDQVQRPVVRIRFLAFNEHVMLSNEMTCNGMQARAKKRRQRQVHNCLHSKYPENCQIEQDARTPVDCFPDSRFFGLDEQRPHHVKQCLTENPQNLLQSVRKKPPLPLARHVDINTINSLVQVMLHVVALKHRKVGEHGDGVREATEESIVRG